MRSPRSSSRPEPADRPDRLAVAGNLPSDPRRDIHSTMGRDRDSSHPPLPEGFDQKGRSLTPISARRIVTSGAKEIVVDDFIDAYLRERPKTIPEMVLRQQTPGPSRVITRSTRRGLGPSTPVPAMPPLESPPAPPPAPQPWQPVGRNAPAPRPSRFGSTPQDPEAARDQEPRTLPRGLERAGSNPHAERLLADRDRRISQLEDELDRVKGELERARPSDPDLDDRRTETNVLAPSRTELDADDVRTVFRPAAPPRPGAAAANPIPSPTRKNISVKTLPMSAVPVPPGPPAKAPQPAIHAGATLFMPSVAPARAPSSLPENAEEGGSATMVLDAHAAIPALRAPATLGVDAPFPAPFPASHPGLAPLQYSPCLESVPVGGSSGFTPPPFEAPSHDPSSPELLHPSPFARPPPAIDSTDAPPERKGAGAWLAFGVLVIAGGLGTFAYLRGMGPFASMRAPSSHDPLKVGASSAAVVDTTRVSGPANASASTGADAAPRPDPSASPAASASAVSSPTSSATTSPMPSTPPVAVGGPDVSLASPDDLKTLLSFQGFLTIRSSVDAVVVLQGQDVGRTNQRLVVRCGPKNIRLRGEGSRWLTDGEPERVTCMEHTVAAIEPGVPRSASKAH